ncbi:hypothetical protein EDB86DRAFT_2954137, partial [Lactarius hatsudake]
VQEPVKISPKRGGATPTDVYATVMVLTFFPSTCRNSIAERLSIIRVNTRIVKSHLKQPFLSTTRRNQYLSRHHSLQDSLSPQVRPTPDRKACVVRTTCVDLTFLAAFGLTNPSQAERTGLALTTCNPASAKSEASCIRISQPTLVVSRRGPLWFWKGRLMAYLTVTWSALTRKWIRQGLEPAASVGIIRAGLHQGQQHPSSMFLTHSSTTFSPQLCVRVSRISHCSILSACHPLARLA